MERIKRRRLKFPCLFEGNEETPKGRKVQSWCPGNTTTDRSLFKFEVGKSTCKRSNQNKTRSSSILAKLMGKDVISSINKQRRIKLKRKEASESYIPPKRIVLLKPNTTDAYDVDHLDDYRENKECFSSDSEVITVPSRVTFGLNDRLSHSLSNLSEPSLITEAKNKISEKWKMSQSSQKSTETYFENDVCAIDDGATYEASSVDSVAIYEIEMSSETSNKLNPKHASSKSSQEPETEHSESLKKVNHGIQVSPVEVPPTEDVLSRSDGFKRLNAQMRDLKKQLHLLKIESLYTSNRPTPTRKRIQLGQQSSVASSWESSFSSHILQVSDIYKTDPDTIHHPRDPRLFYRIEKYYFEGAILSKPEKHLLYDYIEQTFIKISKSMAAGPEKREDQPTLSNLSIEDQVVMVVEEIKKEDAQIFLLNNYDKDPEWLQHNQINDLGKLLSELVLNDLVLELISS